MIMAEFTSHAPFIAAHTSINSSFNCRSFTSRPVPTGACPKPTFSRGCTSPECRYTTCGITVAPSMEIAMYRLDPFSIGTAV